MEFARAIALTVCLGALVGAVVRAREPGTFPLATLVRRWFPGTPSVDLLFVGAGAGLASVVLVPLVEALAGRARIGVVQPITGSWVLLVIAGVAVKTALVFFEELIFRGALVSELRRWTRPAVAVGLSALIFAAAHGQRSAMDKAILLADGVGFALAFVATGSLWVPLAWHLSKNLSVWFFLDGGTLDATHGLLAIEPVGPEWLLGSTGRAGLLDLMVTMLVVGLVVRILRRYRTGPLEAV